MINEFAEWEERRSGENINRPQTEYRHPYLRDRARLIHSAAFRRLQAKTQVLGIGEGDFHRTRLTHSMEVAQIARGITSRLKKVSTDDNCKKWLPKENLIETIALAHDLGHPPFGHGGEVALNYVMRESGGFEGNGQTLRILARLESHTEEYGLDLTRRSLFGILKYPMSYEKVIKKQLSEIPTRLIQLKAENWKPPKCFLLSEQDVVDWIMQPFDNSDRQNLTQCLENEPTNDKHGKSKYHGLDTAIMELADDIAYAVHDFEDAIVLRMVLQEDFDSLAIDIKSKGHDCKKLNKWLKDCAGYENYTAICRDLFGGSSHKRKQAIGALVNAFIVSIETYQNEIFHHPLLRFQVGLTGVSKDVLSALKNLIKEKMVKIPQVQTLEYRGQQIVINIFEAFDSDPTRFLKDSFKGLYEDSERKCSGSGKRVICDYIAGMTDEYATRMYERLFIPRMGRFSDNL